MKARVGIPLILLACVGIIWMQFLPSGGIEGELGMQTSDIASDPASASDSSILTGRVSEDGETTRATVLRSPGAPIEVLAEELSVPWDLGFLPDGSILITERSGSVLHLDGDGLREVARPTVRSRGEGGLLGLLIHPRFEENGHVYLYQTIEENGQVLNRVERYVYQVREESLRDPITIIDAIPGALYHDGGRMEWGPDGKLYIVTGDAQEPALAQDPDSLAGKILRLNQDGTIPRDNPITGSPLYSLGHRNPQGIAWDNAGGMWSTEHGPSLPGFCCRDELNLIEPGGNYGWPEITADQSAPGMESPVLHSGVSAVWAPASLAYHNGSLFFGGLRGEALYEVSLSSEEGTNTPTLTRHFVEEFGRVRTVRVGPDGYLYLTTSNTDGRGEPRAGDDKLIRIDPTLLR